MGLAGEIFETYGGRTRWEAVQSIHVLLSFGGLAFDMRLNRRGLRERNIHISVQHPQVVFDDYPRLGKRGIFTADQVKIESTSGKILSSRNTPRDAFASFRRSIWWDDLDLLYFAGYACWNYFTIPYLFLFDGVELSEIEPGHENGEDFRRLKVKFPKSIPTHSCEQVFWYDSNLHLRRHDYDPEVFASWATAAHYCHEFRTFSGFPFATRRQVVPRMPNGATRSRPILVWIQVKDISLE